MRQRAAQRAAGARRPRLRGVPRPGAWAGLLVALFAPAAGAQTSAGASVGFLGYSFDEGLGADAAQLIIIPVAARLPATERLRFDLYAAWAEGRIEQDDVQLRLAGPVDTRVKATYQATPWALVSIGATLPTGRATHSSEEAVVASVLSTDLLGFSETTWGTGLGLTSSVATAVRAGELGVGLAIAYALRGKFEPSSDVDLEYQPGNEARVRLGIDRNFGNSTLTAGATFINYATDQADGQNLFQAGNRLRIDASYAFRANAGVWTLYAADLVRANGDLRLDIVDDLGAPVGDTTVVTAKQNLFIAGATGAIGLGGGRVLRPHVDYRLQTRTEMDGDDTGSGWIVAAGGDVPFQVFGRYELVPKARILYGSLRSRSAGDVGLLGMELTGTFRGTF